MKIAKASIFFILLVTIVLESACAPAIPDGKIQGDIAQKLTFAGINKVSVIVQNGIATLTGTVPDEVLLNQAEVVAKSVEGVKSVQSTVIVVAPTPEPTPEPESPESTSDETEVPESWEERASAFLNEFMKGRLVNCSDSFYLLKGKTELYQTKKEPFVTIYNGEVFPAQGLSEADKLNGKKPVPETWRGHWGMGIQGPWRVYTNDHWLPWRDDPVNDGAALFYTADGKWISEDPEREHYYQKIGKYKCYGDAIDLESIPGSPIDKNAVSQSNPNDLSETFGKVGNVVYNKKTMTVFIKPAEFFADSGKKSFNGLKFDEQTKLPSGLKFVGGRKLTDDDYRKLK